MVCSSESVSHHLSELLCLSVGGCSPINYKHIIHSVSLFNSLSFIPTYTQTYTSYVCHSETQQDQKDWCSSLKPALGRSWFGALIFSSVYINKQNLCGI